MPRELPDDYLPFAVYDKEGRRIESFSDLTALIGDDTYRLVARSEWWAGEALFLTASTVWLLGINYHPGRSQGPALFETMVFRPSPGVDGDVLNQWTRRWRTESDALTGHKEIVAAIDREVIGAQEFMTRFDEIPGDL